MNQDKEIINEEVVTQAAGVIAEEPVEEKKPKKKKSKKVLIIVLIVVAAIAVLGVIIAKVFSGISEGMSAAMEAMSGEDTCEVEKQDVRQEITTSGTVIGLETRAYTSPVTAKVSDIQVEVGQMVSAGDVLLTYDANELGDNLEKVKIQAQSEKASGSASFEAASDAATKAKDAEKKVKSLKKDVASLKEEVEKLNDQLLAYQDQLEAAETANAKAEVNVVVKEDGTTEAPKLTDTKPIKQAIRDINKQLAAKNEKLGNKQSKLAEQKSVVAANEEVKVAESTKTQVAAANRLSDMNVADAQESYDAAVAGIAADTDGIVQSVDVIEGSYASETQTLLTVIDANAIGVEFSISKDNLGAIVPGQQARVVIGENEYTGTVEYVSRVAVMDGALGVNSTTGGSIKGRVAIDNPDENIFIGVSAKVYIFVGESKGVLAVPYEALNSDIDGDYVYVVNSENLIERKDVEIGIHSDEYYEVLSGIEEGDKVILEVTKNMKPGDPYIPNNMATTVE